jgi:CO dehydrogenase/acetyl-CoA synthase delta subunit
MRMPTETMITTPELTGHDRLDHLQVRLAYKRMDHRVVPGLYRLGSPDQDSPVLVSANYTLSFDALRSSLRGTNCYILVLDTKGVNVWCAAGKGTFGTEEVIRKVRETGLEDIVRHRRIILPQLGAPGVSAHEVKKQTGFSVEYGPVRAKDVQEYLQRGEATPEMRRVTFPLKDRAVLAPVELLQSMKYLVPAIILLFLAGGPFSAFIALATVLGGTVLFPLLLPYLPTREFSSKGVVLGILLSLPLSAWNATVHGDRAAWDLVAFGVGLALLMAPVIGYLGLNFTGSSTYTSRTGVRREIFRWMPVFLAMLIIGTASMIVVAGNALGWY